MVTTTEVKRQDFSHKIEIQGDVETDQNILINAETSGIITSVRVKEGQKVSKGQTLITIDSEILQRNIEELNTSLELANYMYEKQKALAQQGLGTEVELEQAKNQKESLEQKLKTLKSQQGKAVVKAPFSGVIDEVMVNQGEMASPQVPLIRLVNNKDVKITAGVSENHLSKIKVGTNVDLIFPTLNDTVIHSKVSYTGNYIDPTNRTFRIHIEIKNNKVLLPNQLAKIKITDFELDSALVINKNAILQDTDNNDYIYQLIPTGENDEFAVKKIYINILSTYGELAAIEAKNPESNSIDINAQFVFKGGKGITELDIVKVQK